MAALTFNAGDVIVTVGERWVFQFSEHTRMLCEIIGKGAVRSSDTYVPSVKVLQITKDGQDILHHSSWYIGDSSHSPSIGIGDPKWSKLVGQEAPHG